MLRLIVLSAALSAPSANAALSFNSRADTALRAPATALEVFDSDSGSLILGDGKGIQLMQVEGRRLRAFGGEFTEAPVVAVATAVLPAGRFVAYALRGERVIHVHPATEHGTLGKGPTVPVAGRPRAIVAAPPHGFVAVHSSGVDLLEPASAGAFRRHPASAVASAVDAAVIDLNGDDYLDLVLADEPLGELVVLQGVEGNEMGRVATVRTQRAPRQLAVADVDGDGAAEVVVLGELGLSIHDRADDGRLLEERLLVEEPHLAGIAAGDIDGDGIGDLVYTNRSRGVVQSLLGSRSGRLASGPAFLTGDGPGRVLLAPLGAGSRLDIAIANELDDSITLIRHDRRGLLGVAAIVSAIGSISDAAAADFDSDGNLDLVLAGDDTGRLEVHLGQGNGHFTATASYPIGVSPRALLAGDWDGDQHPDLAVADFGADHVAILFGDGKGGFAVPVLIPTGGGPSALLFGDLGGPAGGDIAVANRVSETVSILHGDGKGHFSAGPVFEAKPRPSFLFLGDFDGDGDGDILTGNRQLETITVIPREKVGFGQPYNKVLADVPEPSLAYDLDRDGSTELVVTQTAAAAVAILKGKDGDFKPVRKIAVGRLPSAVELGDFDADGQEDIAVIHKSTGIVAILLRLKN